MLRDVSYTPPPKFILYNPINCGKCKPMYSNRRLVVVWGRLCVCGIAKRHQETLGMPATLVARSSSMHTHVKIYSKHGAYSEPNISQ